MTVLLPREYAVCSKNCGFFTRVPPFTLLLQHYVPFPFDMKTAEDYERFAEMRRRMVERQLVARGIHDKQVLDAMSRIPRENFVPSCYREDAYYDGPLQIGEGQTISQPYMVAIMTQSLCLKNNDKVLEIGTGSGYQTAILLHITPHVYSIERIPSLAEAATIRLRDLGYSTFSIKVGDGTCGWPEEAPFDAIIVTAAAPSIPLTLKQQLSDGGRLVIPVGSRYTQILYKITRSGDSFSVEEITPCVFVPLIGAYGWHNNRNNNFT